VLRGARQLLSGPHPPQLIVEFAESNQAPWGHSALARVGAAPFARTWPTFRQTRRSAPPYRLALRRKGAPRPARHGSRGNLRQAAPPGSSVSNLRGIATFGLPCPLHLSNECGAENNTMTEYPLTGYPLDSGSPNW
jgi:hypothetical protein